MSLYNLTDNVDDSFEIQMGSAIYVMTYPLMSELEQLQEIIDKRNDSTDPQERKDLGEKVEDFMFSFISPKEEGQPPVKEELRKYNVKVMQNFTQMIQKEMGLGQ